MEKPFERQSERLYLLPAVWQCRVEVPVEPAPLVCGNLPYPEEAEYVVDAERVEVLRHLVQPALPPGIAVFRHFLPVVGGEAPVLSVAAEIVGRGAGRGVEVEQLGVPVCLGAVGAHSDREVSLERDAAAPRVCGLLGELPVELPLHPDIVFLLERVPPGTELRIFVEPEGVLPCEPFQGRRAQVLCSARFECAAYVFHLGPEHGRIVNFPEGVEFLPLAQELFVLLYPEVLQVDVEWMQRERRHGTVGVGVLPASAAGGVVDGQQLYYALPCGRSPVYKEPQVMELSYAEVIGAAQREHRDGRARSAEVRPVEHPGAVPARERAALDRAVYPLVLDYRCGSGTVILPLHAPNESVAHHYIPVVLEHRGGASLHRDAPLSSVAPLHGIFPASEAQAEALAPVRHVLDPEKYLHIIASVRAFARCRAANIAMFCNLSSIFRGGVGV